MFTWKPERKPTDLDEEIARLIAHMAIEDEWTKEYSAMADQLKKLYPLKEIDSKSRVSPDTWALIIANLVGIILVIGHERANVITTKALGFVSKLR